MHYTCKSAKYMNVYTSLITTTTGTKTVTKSCTNKEWSLDVTHTHRHTVTSVTCKQIMRDGTYTRIQLVQISPRLISVFQYKMKIHIEATCACACSSTCILLSLSPPTLPPTHAQNENSGREEACKVLFPIPK